MIYVDLGHTSIDMVVKCDVGSDGLSNISRVELSDWGDGPGRTEACNGIGG